MRDVSDQIFCLFGYAGTGKSTLALHLVENSDRRWLFAAYTGKAAHVMRQKGCTGARTLHSLIYRPSGESLATEIRNLTTRIDELLLLELTDEQKDELRRLVATRTKLMEDNRPRFDVWAESPMAEQDVAGVVVDEVSMVDERLARDLESFGKKILVLGDPAQLPPVGGGGHYTGRRPNVMLTEVHRHARESGILSLATHVREGRSLSSWSGPPDVTIVRPGKANEDAALAADQVLVGRNATRRAANVRLRGLLGRGEIVGPSPGDRLVCLRNDREYGLFNGSQWEVAKSDVDVDAMTAEIVLKSEDDGRVVECPTWIHHMMGRSSDLDTMGPSRRDIPEFDWSYAMTVHKAQGSQWRSVVLVDESRSFDSRWLYTGITRASERLVVIS